MIRVQVNLRDVMKLVNTVKIPIHVYLVMIVIILKMEK